MKRQSWTEIKASVTPATRARIESEARSLSDQLHLSQLRKAKGLTQEAMAELLGVTQAEVSKMERRSELYIGTLKKFIEATASSCSPRASPMAPRSRSDWPSPSQCPKTARPGRCRWRREPVPAASPIPPRLGRIEEHWGERECTGEE